MKNMKSKHEGLKEEEEGKIQVPEISTGGEITLCTHRAGSCL